MSGRGNDSLDDRIDAALRAMVAADDRPVDLRARVLAGIDAGQQARRARGRARRAAFPRFRLLPRPALALALAAVLAVVAVAVWPALRHERAPLVSNRGAMTRPTTPLPPAGAHTPALVQGTGPAAGGPSAGACSICASVVATSMIALEPSEGRRPAGRSEPWGALPRLDPPEPIALEPIGEPPMRVAQLEVERLSIDPLEVDALDGSEEE